MEDQPECEKDARPDNTAWTRRDFLGRGASGAALLLATGMAGLTAARSSLAEEGRVDPPSPAPRPRPYLFFGGREVPEMRRRFAQPGRRAECWAQLLRNAAGWLKDPLTTGAADIGRTRPALGAVGTTAFAYALTGDKRYAERARREADSLLACETWIKPSPANRGANLGTGEASMACALFLDWCGDTLTDAERADFARRLFERGIAPYLAAIETHKDWWIENDVTNWSGVVNGGCGLAALALVGDIPEARRAADYARTRVVRFLKTANREDGGGDEGVMYYTYGMLFGSCFAAAAERFFGTDDGVWADMTGKLSGYWLSYMRGPDARYANFNDMDEGTFGGAPPKSVEGGPNATLCALWEAKAARGSSKGKGDRLLTWSADNGGDTWYWRGASPFYLIFRSDRTAPPQAPPLDDNVLFRGSGQTVWKTPALWFAFNGGWNSDRSHYNLDLGSFVLVAGEERLLHDPGYGKAATGDHSTMLVNGKGQARDVRATYRRWGVGEGFRYLACDLSGVYEPAAGLTRFVRHAVLVGDSYVVLLDDLAARADTTFEARFQTREEITVGADGTTALIRGKKARLHLVFAAPEGVLAAQGSGTIRYVSASPGAGKSLSASTLVTVLAPASEGSNPPTVRFDAATGKLQIRGGFQGDLSLQFHRGDGGWALESVNGKSAASIGDGTRRTLTAFR